MKQIWRYVFRWYLITLTIFFSLFYILSLIGDLIFQLAYGYAFSELSFPRSMMLLLFIICYGFLRAYSFQPVWDKSYQQWLTLTPWRYGMKLPKGPVHLIWFDLVFVSSACLLEYLHGSLHPVAPAIAFLCVYLAVFLASIFKTWDFYMKGDKPGFFVMIIPWLFPFVVYPHKNAYITLLVLLGIYGLCYLDWRLYLKEFPWNSKFWRFDIVRHQLDQFRQKKVIGWPYHLYNTIKVDLTDNDYKQEKPVMLFLSVLLGLLLTWWLHVAAWLNDAEVTYTILLWSSVFLALGRWSFYAGNYRPPINIRGRILTGRFLIWSYDKILVAPILVFISGFITPMILNYIIKVNENWIWESLFFFTFVICLTLPPRLRDWRLLGHYRLLKINPKQVSAHRQTGIL